MSRQPSRMGRKARDMVMTQSTLLKTHFFDDLN